MKGNQPFLFSLRVDSVYHLNNNTMKNPSMAWLLLLFASLTACENEDDEPLPENPADMPYNVVIEPDDFVSTNITGNLYWPLATGQVLTYEGEDEDGTA